MAHCIMALVLNRMGKGVNRVGNDLIVLYTYYIVGALCMYISIGRLARDDALVTRLRGVSA
jgi:hypothetical protein